MRTWPHRANFFHPGEFADILYGMWLVGKEHKRQRKLMTPAFSASSIKKLTPAFTATARKVLITYTHPILNYLILSNSSL